MAGKAAQPQSNFTEVQPDEVIDLTQDPAYRWGADAYFWYCMSLNFHSDLGRRLPEWANLSDADKSIWMEVARNTKGYRG